MPLGLTRPLYTLALMATLLLPTIASAQEITLWHAYRGGEKTAFEKVVKQFEASAEGKGIKVKTLAIPYDAYADKISASMPRGRGPDVFIYAQDRLGGWVEAGKTVESIDFYLDKETKDALLPGMLEAMTYNGVIYGLPLNYKSIALIYNKALVKTPPKTTAELVSTAKTLTRVNEGKYGLAYWYTNFYFHAALMNAFGGRAFDSKGNINLASPGGIAATELMLRWFKKDAILPPEPSESLVTSLFNEGKAAMIFNGPWAIGEINPKIDIGIALLPSVNEAKGQRMKPWLTIEGGYVSANSAHKEKAYALVKYLAGAEAGLVMTLEGRQLHTNKAVYKNQKVMADPVLSGFHNQLQYAEAMPNRAEMTMMWSPATTAMNKIAKGASTVAAALGEADATIQSNINQLRKSK